MRWLRPRADEATMGLPTAVGRMEPILRAFLTDDLNFDEFSDRFLSRYRADVDSYDWTTQGVLGSFFTDWDQTAEEPDPHLHEITVGEFRQKVEQLLADPHSYLDD